MSVVQHTLNEVAEMKNKEKNIMIFRLTESSNDKENVLKIFSYLSDDKVTGKNIVKVIRLGAKSENVSRPVIVMFDDVELKELIMRIFLR